VGTLRVDCLAFLPSELTDSNWALVLDVCPKCEHVVAEHTYTFELVEEFQEFTMTCDLCGVGEDEASVLPVNPKKASRLY